MPLPFEFDWKNPDYGRVLQWRADRLEQLRADAGLADFLRAYYRENPAQLIIDWGVTYDPRNVRRGLPASLPFLLFPKQEELAGWLLERWKNGENGLIEKSRDMGISWLVMALACSLCLTNPEMSIGCGSRKQELVDTLGDPDSLLEKARIFTAALPREFRGGWDRKLHSSHMKIVFPSTGSILTGEAGDNIGRGGRQSIYLVDEAAHIERPHLIEASLSATTNCRIDLSSVKGMANLFAEKRHSGRVPVFTFHWRSDPRKDDAWYADQVESLDPVTLAQEVDISYNASVEGVVIPSAWVQAAIGAARKLNIEPTGHRAASLDIADEGRDKNALCGGQGIEVRQVEEWSGVGADIFATVERAFGLADEHDYERIRFDSDGLGAGARGDARVINERRQANRQRLIRFEPFRGSEAVDHPEREDVKGRKNKDFFANRKAQAWWALRSRFRATFRAVVEGHPFKPDELVSIAEDCPNLAKLTTELSQPTYSVNAVGKIVIDKAPEGSKSPNLADAVMIHFSSPAGSGIRITPDLLARI